MDSSGGIDVFEEPNPWDMDSLPDDAPGWAVRLYKKVQDLEEDNLIRSPDETSEMCKLREELRATKYQLALVKSECDSLKKRVISMESQSRRDNLIFDGFPEEKGETSVDCIRKVKTVASVMGVTDSDMKISRAHRVGPYRPKYDRPIIAKFHYFGDRMNMYNNRKELKGKQVLGNKIYVNEDFPVEIMKNRRILQPVYKQAISMDKYKSKTRMSVDRLIIDSVTYTVDTMDRLPDDLNPTRIHERESEDGQIRVFFGQNSPLSNFHSAGFIHEGMGYNCSEQYIQANKAEYFADDNITAGIMKADSPHRQKALSYKIKNFDRKAWEEVAYGIAKDGIREKFVQNEHLKIYLLNTGSKVLGEASADQLWGTGVKLKDVDCTVKTKWSGRNLLGRILMEIRDELKANNL